MKRKNLILVAILVLSALFAIQSCTKDETPTPTIYKAAVPVLMPADSNIYKFTGTAKTIDLSWGGDATSGSWDVYFGTDAKPSKVATVTSNAYSPRVTKGGTYYWQVVTVDANNVKSTSEVWSFEVNSAPTVPTSMVPAANAIKVSCNPTLKWTATDAEEDDLTYDLYLGKTATPLISVSGITDVSYVVSATLTANTDYYWKIVAHDPYGGKSESPILKFTTGALPITTYTGNYKADEPAEAYSYDVAFTFVTASTIKTTNYWNSGWSATFTIDLAKLTYNMTSYTFSTGWTGVESGIIDPATGTMTGTYTLWLNGVINEQGVHTYTKK